MTAVLLGKLLLSNKRKIHLLRLYYNISSILWAENLNEHEPVGKEELWNAGLCGTLSRGACDADSDSGKCKKPFRLRMLSLQRHSLFCFHMKRPRVRPGIRSVGLQEKMPSIKKMITAPLSQCACKEKAEWMNNYGKETAKGRWGKRKKREEGGRFAK